MGYVVMDMEWNQAMSSQSAVFNKLPIHLRGEIIQIGAVKLTEDFLPGEEFQIDIKPVFFKKMHYKVEKLTGIDKERLEFAPGFSLAQYTAPASFHNKSLLELNLRKKFQVNLIGLRKAEDITEDIKKTSGPVINVPLPETIIHEGDLLWLVGSDDDLAQLPNK